MIAGTLEIQLMANLARLAQDMESAKRSVAGAMSNIERSVEQAKRALGALGVGLTADYFIGLVRGSINAQDHLNDLNKSTDLSVEQLAGLALAARQTGSDLDSTAAAINKLAVNMGKDADKFAALGVTAKDPLQALQQLADVFSRIQDPQLRAAMAAEALGKTWAGTAPLLAKGGDAIGKMVERGSKLSAVTQENALQADKFNDQLAELTGTGGTLNAVVAPMLPLLNELASDLIKLRDGSAELPGNFNLVAESLRAVLVLGGNVAFVFKGVGTEIGGIAAQISALARGDWRSVLQIRDMMKQDAAAARVAFDEWEQRMMGVGKGGPNLPAPEGVDPADARAAAEGARAFLEAEERRKRAAEDARKAEEEARKALELDTKGWVAHADAVLEEGERIAEEERRQAEAANDYEERMRREDLKGWVAYAEARVNEDFEMQQQLAKQQIEAAEAERKEQAEVWRSVDRTAHDTFISLYKGGRDVFTRLRDTLENTLLELLYQMTMKKWIINIEQQITGAGGLDKYMGGLWDKGLAAIGFGGPSTFTNDMGGIELAGSTGFASGGTHLGGWRMVGESGPELEATGAARIYNAQQTRQILGGAGGGEKIVFAPVINIDSRTDRTEVHQIVSNALQAGQAQLVDRLERQGRL